MPRDTRQTPSKDLKNSLSPTAPMKGSMLTWDPVYLLVDFAHCNGALCTLGGGGMRFLLFHVKQDLFFLPRVIGPPGPKP